MNSLIKKKGKRIKEGIKNERKNKRGPKSGRVDSAADV